MQMRCDASAEYAYMIRSGKITIMGAKTIDDKKRM